MRGHTVGAVFALLLFLMPAAAPAQTVEAPDVRVRLNGRAQIQFNTTSVDEEDLGDPEGEIAFSTFETRRIRFAAELEIDDWITGKVEPDFAAGRLRLADAWLNFRFGEALQLRAGHFKKPFSIFELTSSTQILTIERGVRIRGLEDAALRAAPDLFVRADGEEVILGEEQEVLSDLAYLSRDLGAAIHGRLGPLSYEAGMFNGEGVSEDTNDQKSFAGRLELQPFPRLPLAIGGAVSYRETVAADSTVEGAVAAVDLEWGEFRRPGPHLMAEAVLGRNYVADARLAGGQAALAWYVPLRTDRLEGFEIVARASAADPNDDIVGDHAWLFTPGVTFYYHGRNRLMVNWDVFLPADDRIEAEHALRAQAQLYF
ncbi:MAG: hypothetical protein HY561_06990 [Gemmatimonadetes bacterium]|nr:hypothetical protein [Gemmatimonadota bacterium]